MDASLPVSPLAGYQILPPAKFRREKMDEINKLNLVINNKANEKLQKYIKTLRLCDIDENNTHVEIPKDFGYTITNQGDKDYGKRFSRADEVLRLLKEAIYRKELLNFQEVERKSFLNDLQQLRDYLNSND